MSSDHRPYWVTALVVLATAAILLWMGRAPICDCGYVRLWYGGGGSEGSQHLFDWYTPSHIIHGILFYAAAHFAMPRASFGWRLCAATVVEAAWEIAENTDRVINRYREATIAADYFGDSVVNSVADIAAMWAGFWLAHRLPVPATVALVLGLEVLTAFVIRDGLALNVLMLLAPSDAVRDWQAGG